MRVRLLRAGKEVFSAKSANMTDSEAQQLAIMVLKVADLSYPSKGLSYSLKWIERCLDEFFEQVTAGAAIATTSSSSTAEQGQRFTPAAAQQSRSHEQGQHVAACRLFSLPPPHTLPILTLPYSSTLLLSTQGDREKELGLPVGYDRVTCDKPKSQVGFFTFFVQPMYETLGECSHTHNAHRPEGSHTQYPSPPDAATDDRCAHCVVCVRTLLLLQV